MMRSAANRFIDYYLMINGNESSYLIYNNLLKMEKMRKKEVEQITQQKIKAIVVHAANNVPYYSKIFKENSFDPQGFDDVTQLEKIPMFTKNIIRNNFPDNLISASLKNRAVYNTTSGSTGEPLEFYNDSLANSYRRASFMYFNHMMGVKPIDTHWNLKSLGKTTGRQGFNYWLLGKSLYSVMDVKKENLQQIKQQIEKIKPQYIEGYSASLVRLAFLLKENGYTIDNEIKAIIATSESLTGAGRDMLEDVFHSKVFNRYGSREFSGAVSQECAVHDGYHLNPLLSYMEVVDENGENVSKGETGRILITDLNNQVMPFIRYDIGDFGTKGDSDCPCGVPFSIIKSIEGRTGEFILDKNGQQIPFITVSAYLFRRNYAPYVTMYQFEQDKPGKITLKLVPNEKLTDFIYDEISNTLNEQLPGFENEVIIVDDIQPQKTGKTPFLQKI